MILYSSRNSFIILSLFYKATYCSFNELMCEPVLCLSSDILRTPRSVSPGK